MHRIVLFLLTLLLCGELAAQSSLYEREQQEKYRWVEYHKWKFKGKTYTALTSGQKCLVLMTRLEFGSLGSFNKWK